MRFCKALLITPGKNAIENFNLLLLLKCVQGNTYRIKQANNFRKRFLRHRDQLRVLRARPERLRPTQGENGSGHTVIVPPVLAISSQP